MLCKYGFEMVLRGKTPIISGSGKPLVALILVYSLSGCSAEGLPSNNTVQTPELGSANPTIGETPPLTKPPQTSDRGALPDEGEPSAGITPNGESGQPDENNTSSDANPSIDLSQNLAPTIRDTSYRCDPVLESVSYNLGETDTFTLSVDDDNPSDLRFSADSSDAEKVGVSVDANGIFTAMALEKGASYLWLSVSDTEGLVDEYELHVVVQ